MKWKVTTWLQRPKDEARTGKVRRRRKEQHHCSQKSQQWNCAVAPFSSTATRELVLSNVHHICTKPESTYFLPFFKGLSVICPQSVFCVFGVIIEIQRNRFQRVVMHVSIVKEWRNVVRWKSTPASRRNKRRRSQVAIFLQIWTFFENLCGKPFTLSMLGSNLRWSPLLMQYLTHSTSSSRFPLNFKPLHFSHRFSWSTVYSSASLSNLEPGMPSSSVRTVQDWRELLAIHVFFPITLTEFDFVCLSHGGGQNVVTSLVQSAIGCWSLCYTNSLSTGLLFSYLIIQLQLMNSWLNAPIRNLMLHFNISVRTISELY